MSKAKKVKAGKLYTNGRAQVVYVADVWENSIFNTICEVHPVQYVSLGYAEMMSEDDVLKRWPLIVQKIVIEQE